MKNGNENENENKESFQQKVFKAIEKKTGNRNKIVIPEAILKFSGDIETAIVLSQLIYWCDKGGSQDGFIFKSQKEWHQETLLSRYQISKSTKRLVEMGIIKIKIKQAYGNPTNHYKLIRKAFTDAFLKFLKKEFEIFKNGFLKNENSITENTTYITTEKNNSLSDIESFYNEWNRKATVSNLVVARELTSARQKKIASRLKEKPLDEWLEIINLCSKIPFLNGVNKNNWRASLGWLIADRDKGLKILEGSYGQPKEEPCTKEFVEEENKKTNRRRYL